MPRRANKRVLEALIRAGAMDSFRGLPDESIETRAGAPGSTELPATLQGAEQAARDAEIGIDDMFGGVSEGVSAIVPRTMSGPLTKRERLEAEKDALGLYLTGHPIEDYLGEIRRFCPTQIAGLDAQGRPTGGSRSGRLQPFPARTPGQPWAFVHARRPAAGGSR